MSVYLHPTADVQSEMIGEGTNIWQFCVILPKAEIGRDCNICSHCFIENDVVVGDRITIKCGVQLWDGLRVEDDVFIGPNVTFLNDVFPRSKKEFSLMKTIIKRGATIGGNSTILPGIKVGENSMIGAGSLVNKDIPPNVVAFGNPAKVIRSVTEDSYVDK